MKQEVPPVAKSRLATVLSAPRKQQQHRAAFLLVAGKNWQWLASSPRIVTIWFCCCATATNLLATDNFIRLLACGYVPTRWPFDFWAAYIATRGAVRRHILPKPVRWYHAVSVNKLQPAQLTPHWLRVSSIHRWEPCKVASVYVCFVLLEQMGSSVSLDSASLSGHYLWLSRRVHGARLISISRYERALQLLGDFFKIQHESRRSLKTVTHRHAATSSRAGRDWAGPPRANAHAPPDVQHCSAALGIYFVRVWTENGSLLH